MPLPPTLLRLVLLGQLQELPGPRLQSPAAEQQPVVLPGPPSAMLPAVLLPECQEPLQASLLPAGPQRPAEQPQEVVLRRGQPRVRHPQHTATAVP